MSLVLRSSLCVALTMCAAACNDDTDVAASSTSSSGTGASSGSSSSQGGSSAATGGAGGAGLTGCADPHPATALPEGVGWHELPNTMLEPLCPDEPDIHGATGCAAVISAWNGGIADVCRNRLVFWGGGHNDYYGNEIYALELAENPPKLTRLTEPSVPPASCEDEAPDGNAASRHTYNGLSNIESADAMFVVGGATACPTGLEAEDTWTFALGSLTWTRQDPTIGGPPDNSYSGKFSGYDPTTDRVYVNDAWNFWSYDVATNTYEQRADTAGYFEGHATAAVDPVRRLIVTIGGDRAVAYHIDDDTLEDWAAQLTGCDPLVAMNSPGLVYDDSRGLLVGWPGGDSVYELDLDTKTCTEVTHAGGPGAQQQNGTFGRFRYFPEPNVFAVVNDWQQNAYILRLQ